MYFYIAVQHIAGGNLKFTGFLSRNPSENASQEKISEKRYVINILIEQAELNAKYGEIFVNQVFATKKRLNT